MISINYDHRENSSGIPAMLLFEGVQLHEQQLPVGDYILSERVIVERKSAADFVSSLKDGRLFEQAQRLKDSCQRPMLLLVGQPNFRQESVDGALASLMRRGIPVIYAEDEHQAAQWLMRLARQEQKSSPSTRRKIGQRKTRARDEVAEDILASVPGISISKAQLLLRHFDSVQNVINAEAEQLQQLPGIGKKTAENLVLIFRHTFRSQDSY